MEDVELLGEEEGFEEELLDEEKLFLEQEITECFSVFDQKEKGVMPSKFLDKALKSLGISLTSFEIEELLEKYDKDGSIEFLDFKELVSEKINEVEPATLLKSAFAVFDPEGEGTIPMDRFKKWMTTLGDRLTESEVKELYKMGDPSNKGVFVYGDVVNMLLY